MPCSMIAIRLSIKVFTLTFIFIVVCLSTITAQTHGRTTIENEHKKHWGCIQNQILPYYI